MVSQPIDDQLVRLSSIVVSFIRRRRLVVPNVSNRRGSLNALLNSNGGQAIIVVRLGYEEPYPIVGVQGAYYGVWGTSGDINKGPYVVILYSSIGWKWASSRVKPPELSHAILFDRECDVLKHFLDGAPLVLGYLSLVRHYWEVRSIIVYRHVEYACGCGWTTGHILIR